MRGRVMQLPLLLFNAICWLLLFLYAPAPPAPAASRPVPPDAPSANPRSSDAPAPPPDCPALPGLQTLNIGSRRALVYHPPLPPGAHPLVIAYHGMTRSAFYMLAETGWAAMSTSHKFILAFPDSSDEFKERYGKAGWFSTHAGSHSRNPDLRFHRALMAELSSPEREVRADQNRTLVLGLSNGALFAMNVLADPATYAPGGYPPAAACPWMGAWDDGWGREDAKPAGLPDKLPPVFLAWGSEDRWAAPGSRDAARVLRAWGAEVTTREVGGFGHRYDPRTEGEMWAWFEKVIGSTG
ncbi:hypothetical protein DFJ74DRAFT_714326 [Hyaloraphidium curvatum]|nr:hypothetical protein DFJ74DRAFT_714326 [Hyaloraphidium curvatum]